MSGHLHCSSRYMSKVILDQPNPAELTNCRDPSSNPKAELPTQQMLFFLNLMHIRDIKDYTKPHAY